MSTIINESTRDGNLTDTDSTRRMRFLDQLSGYRVHHDDVDPRGFSVKLRSGGDSIGVVEGLLADTVAKVVRYVEIEFDDVVINRHNRDLYPDDNRHALIPMGLIHIDSAASTVYLEGVSGDHIVDYPRYSKAHGHTSGYEIDTNDYLAGFHEYGATYDRDRYSTDTYRTADELDDPFYTSDFYTPRSSR